MPKFDVAREQIAYLRFWLGVMVAADVGLMGWLLTGSGSASSFRISVAGIAVVLIACAAFRADRRMVGRIRDLEDL